ncbi:MAG: hypothetical protein F6K62_02050 [Sphaerospermopsis sp. SIO1G2]|nr:hypothetical protein [Sphaerospermopsis sp. SIO1G1]NET69858.1 hypothetical protein [Sphaerospermopsis sp. SIO1G2]
MIVSRYNCAGVIGLNLPFANFFGLSLLIFLDSILSQKFSHAIALSHLKKRSPSNTSIT